MKKIHFLSEKGIEVRETSRIGLLIPEGWEKDKPSLTTEYRPKPIKADAVFDLDFSEKILWELAEYPDFGEKEWEEL